MKVLPGWKDTSPLCSEYVYHAFMELWRRTRVCYSCTCPLRVYHRGKEVAARCRFPSILQLRESCQNIDCCWRRRKKIKTQLPTNDRVFFNSLTGRCIFSLKKTKQNLIKYSLCEEVYHDCAVFGPPF